MSVSWIDKIKSMINKEDKSPELKKGGIKNILLTVAAKHLSDFHFLDCHRSCYTFQRIRNVGGYNVYETLHINISKKDKNFACSVASRLNSSLLYNDQYNSGLINPHTDLIVLKKGTGVIPIEEAYYWHNGKIESATNIVESIFKDYVEYGLPFLERQFVMLTNNEIIKEGLAYISGLNIDKVLMKIEIETQLRQNGQMISGVKSPIFIDLKEHLQKIKGQTISDRKQIPKFAFELLELYYNS
jgi:hypothetical protein